ncbi:lipoyltransferase [Microthyrium microscopicum]|uniref:Octanoyltransferase n=1 Tax=Microthyrium microscopicum TaxID=703497 RepID=A0A6A6USU3_9PEZI|nr:lipoyltransferase [Microthyrium microscopicum]
MKLRHIHIPTLLSYPTASHIQSQIVSRQLAHKAALSQRTLGAHPNTHSPSTPPAPTILTFSPPPTYTAGLRSTNRLTPNAIAELRATGADFYYAPRGGQTTFHGPGQLVAYPILDLRAHGLSPRCYVRLLEDAVIETCKAYGVRAYTTDDVGVWTGEKGEERKIAAVGVHMRRHVTVHGVGLNVATDLGWFDRIVACGIEGMRSASLVGEGVEGVDVEGVGRRLVGVLARRLDGVDGVEDVEGAERDEMVRIAEMEEDNS